MNEGNILDEILLDLFDQAIDSVNKNKDINQSQNKTSKSNLFNNNCDYKCSGCTALDCDGEIDEDNEILTKLFNFNDDFIDDEMDSPDCFNCTNCCDDTCKCKDCEDSEFKEIQFVFIDRVIFNDPATIIIWSDGTKTIAKCESCDTFSKEIGFLTCFAKKMMGNTEFHKAMHEHVYNSDAEPKAKDNEENYSAVEEPARSGSKRHKGRANEAKANKPTQDESIISLQGEATVSEPKDF